MPLRLTEAQAAPLAHLDFLELLVEDELNRRADRLRHETERLWRKWLGRRNRDGPLSWRRFRLFLER